MKGLLLGLLLTASHTPPATTVSYQSSDWKLNGELAGHCMLATLGNVRESSGARVTVQCEDGEKLTGNVSFKLPVTNQQHRRITLVADVEQDERMSSTLWIKSSRDSQTMLFESDAEEALFNSRSGVRRTVTSVIANDADAITVGLMLHGNGVATIKNVHVTISEQGDISPQAKSVLDAALAFIRQHADHDSRDWNLLNTQAQQFAAGAQDTADVYPVIRYVLQQLGDRRSMVLPPDAARVLDQFRSSSSSAVKIIALPDGADLVLAASTTSDQASDSRVARNWP